MATVEELFRKMTVSQMLQQPGRVTPLCEGGPLPMMQLGGLAGPTSISISAESNP
jgi:hypothetical protein